MQAMVSFMFRKSKNNYFSKKFILNRDNKAKKISTLNVF